MMIQIILIYQDLSALIFSQLLPFPGSCPCQKNNRGTEGYKGQLKSFLKNLGIYLFIFFFLKGGVGVE